MNAEKTSKVSFKDDQRRLASLALDLAEQDWEMLGLADDTATNDIAASTNLDVTVERVTSLLLMRLIALASPSHKFADLSTTSIAKRISSSEYLTSVWPEAVTEKVLTELRQFVRVMLAGYNDVPYHNRNHAYHVFISSNKLLNQVLQSRSTSPEKPENSANELCFEEDPLMHLSLLFAALIHDVDHLGVPNAQLINENHPLALQYNDQSIAEQRSLYLAFCELLKPDYENLRTVMFPFTFAGDGYKRFRSAVTSLVLATDIADKDRSEIVKKKWRDAFEDIPCSSAGSRVLPTSGQKKKKRMPKGNAASMIGPPKEHPTPRQSRGKLTMEVKAKNALSPTFVESDDEWVDLGATPSTHFPSKKDSRPLSKRTEHAMQESLVFWWFAPEEESLEEEFDEFDHTEGYDSFFNESDLEFFDAASQGDMASKSSLSKSSEKPPSKFDMGSSMSAEDTANTDLLESYSFPHQSQQAFEFSCSSMDPNGSVDLQHLLSPSKSGRKKPPPRTSSLSFGKRSGRSAAYSDLSIQSGSDPCLKNSPPRRSVSLFCTPTRKTRKKPIVDVDVSETETETADLTLTDVSTCGTLGTNDSKTTQESPKREANKAKTKPEQTKSEQLCTISLMEHILLVSDVAHTMQCFDLMNKFALNLANEIQASVDQNRSGGITADPLDEWYSNQSGFLMGYIKPLAERIEKTGYIPVLKPSLTTLVQNNFDRWQEEGHDVIAAWRRTRERQKDDAREKRTKSKAKKTSKKSSKLNAAKSPSSKKRKNPKKKDAGTEKYSSQDFDITSPVIPSRPKKSTSPKKPSRKSSSKKTKAPSSGHGSVPPENVPIASPKTPSRPKKSLSPSKPARKASSKKVKEADPSPKTPSRPKKSPSTSRPERKESKAATKEKSKKLDALQVSNSIDATSNHAALEVFERPVSFRSP